MKKLLLVTFITALAPALASASFDRNLKYGMSGNDVRELQDILNESACLNVSSTGYFGILTLNAVKCWQSKSSLPNTGYFGPMSREKMNALVSVATASSTEAEITETGTTTPVTSQPAIQYVYVYQNASTNTTQNQGQTLGSTMTDISNLVVTKNYSPLERCVTGEGNEIIQIGSASFNPSALKIRKIDFTVQSSDPDGAIIQVYNGGSQISGEKLENKIYTVTDSNPGNTTDGLNFRLIDVKKPMTVTLSVDSVKDSFDRELVNEPITFSPIIIKACEQ